MEGGREGGRERRKEGEREGERERERGRKGGRGKAFLLTHSNDSHPLPSKPLLHIGSQLQEKALKVTEA